MSPSSFGQTLGRQLHPGVDFFPAVLGGYGRRWNYAVSHIEGRTTNGALRTIIALGVVKALGESTNGVVGWVTNDEIPELDRREREYDRVDVSGFTTVTAAVTTSITTSTPIDIDGQIVTYVPRPTAIANYEAARDNGTAAIEQRYWDIVEQAFRDLGDGQLERYRATTPAPDVPIDKIERH